MVFFSDRQKCFDLRDGFQHKMPKRHVLTDIIRLAWSKKQTKTKSGKGGVRKIYIDNGGIFVICGTMATVISV